LQTLLLVLLGLASGDVIDQPLRVKYSGEDFTWTATAGSSNPGDFMELEITERVTGSPIARYTAPIVNGQIVFVATIPRTGLYDGRVRSCNDGDGPSDERCSSWTPSSNLILAILAPRSCDMPLTGRLQPKTLRWAASPSPDVAGYRLYYSTDFDISDYESESYVDVGPATEYDIADLGLEDGQYWFMAVAYDEAGNLSAGSESGPFVLDVTAPEPAGVVEEVVG